MKPYYKICIGLGLIAASLVMEQNIVRTLVFAGSGTIAGLITLAVKNN